jgi:hypothetical protein
MNNICIVWHDHGLCTTIIWAKSYDQRDLLLCLAFDLTFVCDRHTIYAWGHNYGFNRSMGHLRSYSVDLLVEDGMWQYLGHQYCTTGPSGQHQLYRRVNDLLLELCCLTYKINFIFSNWQNNKDNTYLLQNGKMQNWSIWLA